MKETFEILNVHLEDYFFVDDELWIYVQVLERFEYLEETLIYEGYVRNGIKYLQMDSPTYPFEYHVFKKVR